MIHDHFWSIQRGSEGVLVNFVLLKLLFMCSL
jgi:hypothetical protein